MSSLISSPLSATELTGSFSREAFAAHLETVKHLPAWWLDRKRVAYEKFSALPMPARTNEAWRFSNISTLTLDGFTVSGNALPTALLPTPFGSPALTFVNNRLSARSVLTGELVAKGVVVSTLNEAATKHAELLKAHFMAQPQKLGSEKFAALHTAFVSDGAFIYIPRGVKLTEPIIITHAVAGQGSAVFPHTLVVAEEPTPTDLRRSRGAQCCHDVAGQRDVDPRALRIAGPKVLE